MEALPVYFNPLRDVSNCVSNGQFPNSTNSKAELSPRSNDELPNYSHEYSDEKGSTPANSAATHEPSYGTPEFAREVERLTQKKLLDAQLLKAAIASWRNKDYAGAFNQLKQLAKDNVPEAQYHLAKMYEHGNRIVAVNSDKAIKWYERAVQNRYYKAFNPLGTLYVSEKEYEKALELFTITANRGDSTGYRNLGYLYHHGYGVDYDYEQALYFYKTALRLGHPKVSEDINDLNDQHLELACADWDEGSYQLAVAKFELLALENIESALIVRDLRNSHLESSTKERLMGELIQLIQNYDNEGLAHFSENLYSEDDLGTKASNQKIVDTYRNIKNKYFDYLDGDNGKQQDLRKAILMKHLALYVANRPKC